MWSTYPKLEGDLYNPCIDKIYDTLYKIWKWKDLLQRRKTEENYIVYKEKIYDKNTHLIYPIIQLKMKETYGKI